MARPTLLLIHGIGGTRAFWDPTLRSLRDYECVAVDVRGFGDAPPLDEPVTVARYAAALEDQLQQDDVGPVVVIGHSLGGMIAQELAFLARDRVRGLVLCNTLPGVTEGAREFNPVLATLAETEGATAVADALLPAMFGPQLLENTDAAQERFLADMQSADPASLAAAFRAVLTFDARERLPELSMRALVIAGQHEGNDADQEELADLLDARCVFLPGTGHLAPVEAPSAFAAEVLPFLARVRNRSGDAWR
jgi:3-oxoadipate enol-lactonase